MQKMSPNGRGFEFPSGQANIFPKKYTRNIKSLLNTVKSTATVIESWSMTIYIDSTSRNVDSTLSLFECMFNNDTKYEV
jgi:hypothetical protein